MTKSTITREESVQAVFDLKVGYRLGFADIEILKRVARMALAAMDSEPVVQPVMFIDGDISSDDADKLAKIIREFNEEDERPLAKMARIIRENPHPTNECDMPKAQPAPVVPEIDRKAIADKVYGKCSRIPGATFYNAAEFAIDEMEACRAAMLQAVPLTNEGDIALHNYRTALEGIGHIRRTLEETFGGLHGTHVEPDVLMECKTICDAIYAAYRGSAQGVPEEKLMPNSLSMYAVDAVAAIAEVRGWNACRSAMLQESQKSAGASNNCRSSENVQVMQDVSRCSTKAAPALDSSPKTAEPRGGNSPVIPDGYVMVPKEPTERMVIDGFESEPDETFSEPEVWEAYQKMSGCEQAAYRVRLCWAAMLTAAPQEVK